MKPTEYTSAYLIACAELHHLDFIADSFVKSAKLLYENADGSAYSQSFQLLASVAFELFPKILIAAGICLQHKDNVHISVKNLKTEINSKLMKSGHNLKNLFEQFPDLMREIKIELITKVPDDPSKEWFVSEYRFKMENENNLLSIKDVEAARYGSFAQNKDVALDFSGEQKTIHLLLELQNKVRERKDLIINQMREAYK